MHVVFSNRLAAVRRRARTQFNRATKRNTYARRPPPHMAPSEAVHSSINLVPTFRHGGRFLCPKCPDELSIRRG
jgi:hypothetical protein